MERVIEYWHRLPPSIMGYKNLDRRKDAAIVSLKRIDPELEFVKIEGNLCLAVKVKKIAPTE